jgi:hypothetical protein
MPRRVARLKAALHPWLDPVLSLPDHRQARRGLARLADGEYRAGVDVPYCAQFASRERINDYIHHQYGGAQDPNWRVFGTDDPAAYAFWAPRVCALACLKMAIEAFSPMLKPSLWELVHEGLAVNGYTVRDAQGNLADEGWYHHAQVHLAKRYGLQAVGRSYVSPLSVCAYVRGGWLVAASVTPEIGERQPQGRRYGGHLVLVYGFVWKGGRPAEYLLHNPSGRFTELQANARIAAPRFQASLAHRLIALHPLP